MSWLFRFGCQVNLDFINDSAVCQDLHIHYWKIVDVGFVFGVQLEVIPCKVARRVYWSSELLFGLSFCFCSNVSFSRGSALGLSTGGWVTLDVWHWRPENLCCERRLRGLEKSVVIFQYMLGVIVSQYLLGCSFLWWYLFGFF